MANLILRGGVFWLSETKIRLLPEELRTNVHDSRPFLVLSLDAKNTDIDWPVVIGCPISTASSWVSPYDVEIDGEVSKQYGLDKRSWIRISALQPVEKRALGDYYGMISDDIKNKVNASLIEYLDLLEELTRIAE